MRLFTFRRPARAAQPVRSVRSRLNLEFLEQRETPSDFPTGGQLPNHPGFGGPPLESWNAAPVIQDFLVTGIGLNTYQITGKVIDEQPGGLIVTLGGGISGIDGVEVTTDEYGNFSIIVTVASGTQGMVTADVSDNEGVAAETVMDDIG